MQAPRGYRRDSAQASDLYRLQAVSRAAVSQAAIGIVAPRPHCLICFECQRVSVTRCEFCHASDARYQHGLSAIDDGAIADLPTAIPTPSQHRAIAAHRQAVIRRRARADHLRYRCHRQGRSGGRCRRDALIQDRRTHGIIRRIAGIAHADRVCSHRERTGRVAGRATAERQGLQHRRSIVKTDIPDRTRSRHRRRECHRCAKQRRVRAAAQSN